MCAAHVPDDAAIVRLIVGKDEQGLRALLEVHGPAVEGSHRKTYREVLSPEEIDEILNHAAFNAWRRIDQFDESRGSLGAWFLTIARNAARDYLRQTDRQGLNLIEDPSEHVDPRSVVEDSSDDPELQSLTEAVDQVTEAVDQIIENVLSPQQREIILADMAAGGQADNGRLAARLGTSPPAVYTARSKAHKRIREELAKRGLASARKE